MTSKLISVREDIYDQLQQLKAPDESFSDAIERLLTERKKNVLRHFGNGCDLPGGFLNQFENAILETRQDDIIAERQEQTDLMDDKP